jgi:protein gp37
MNKSAISWTTVTWNPVHGCSRVSEGCRNCYAERLSLERGWTQKPWTGANASSNVSIKRHKLNEPLKLKEPSRIFVNSMSDLFHPLIPDDYIAEVFDVMNKCPHHVFQVLTKRPERAAKWTYGWATHIWMGTSVEEQRVTHRIDTLRTCAAHVKFISAEPLISPLDNANLSGFDWLIVGGESGDSFRPMPHAWARTIRDLCLAQGVAFFFKQSAARRTELGTSLLHEDGTFWTWHQFPENHVEPIQAKPHRYTCEAVTPSATRAPELPRSTPAQVPSRDINAPFVQQPQNQNLPPQMHQLPLFD